VLKHDPQPAEMAEVNAANESIYYDPDDLTSGLSRGRRRMGHPTAGSNLENGSPA
jgi:hypothetical protein